MSYRSNREHFDIAEQFRMDEQELAGCTILFAAYELDYLQSQALVVFERKGQLYEVNGSHCSCYDLEGQWEPEETSVEALRHRLNEGIFGEILGEYAQEFEQMLDEVSERKPPRY